MPTPTMSQGSILTLDNVVAGYGRMTILNGISASIRRGAITTVIGPNGAGKSTLFKTVFGVLVFYGLGFGLLGKVGAAAAVGMAIAFYVLQVFLEQAWMKRFKLGPVEWLWRSLTYLQVQPIWREAKTKWPVTPALVAPGEQAES